MKLSVQRKIKFNYIQFIFLCCFILFFCFSFGVYAQVLSAKSNQLAKRKVEVSIYLIRLFDISERENFFDIKYRLILKHRNKDPKLLNQIKLVNAKEIRLISSRQFKRADGFYETVGEYTAKVYYHLSLNRYPFDQQNLKLEFEAEFNANYKIQLIPSNLTQLSVVADKSFLDSIKEWRVKKVSTQTGSQFYPASFPQKKQNEKIGVSKLSYLISIQRVGYRLFIVTFSAMYLAVILSFIALCIPARKGFYNPRFSLIAASVWALVGNNLLTYNIFQHTHRLSLTDQLQVLSAFYVIFALVVVLVNSYLRNKVDRTDATRRTVIIGIVSFVIYILINTLLITLN